MNILAIGNSFSTDAMRYLHEIAMADGEKITTVNLYIGGCPLDLHEENIKNDARAYSIEYNGETTGFSVSIKEALLSREWDVVTLQQVSTRSPDYKTYTPHIFSVANYVRELAPNAKILIHQTWAYEDGSERLCDELGYKTSGEMFADIEQSYNMACKDVNAVGIIRCGEVFHKLVEQKVTPVHRDTFHASFGAGRYALGLCWYKSLTGKSVANNKFCNFDEDVDPVVAEKIRKCVDETITKVI